MLATFAFNRITYNFFLRDEQLFIDTFAKLKYKRVRFVYMSIVIHIHCYLNIRASWVE